VPPIFGLIDSCTASASCARFTMRWRRPPSLQEHPNNLPSADPVGTGANCASASRTGSQAHRLEPIRSKRTSHLRSTSLVLGFALISAERRVFAARWPHELGCPDYRVAPVGGSRLTSIEGKLTADDCARGQSAPR